MQEDRLRKLSVHFVLRGQKTESKMHTKVAVHLPLYNQVATFGRN